MRRIIFFILVVFMSLLMMADASDGVKQTFKTDPGTPASIIYVGVDEDVTIEKHDRNEIVVDFRKEFKGSNSASNIKRFEGIRPEMSFQDNTLNIRIKYPKRGFSFSGIFSGFRLRISTRLLVPANTNIDIKIVDGDLEVSGVGAKVALKTVDGDIQVNRCVGDMDFYTTDGDINLEQSEGTLNASSVDGDIHASGVFSHVFGKTVDGDVTVAFEKGSVLKSDSTFDAVDGDVEISIAGDFDFKLDFKADDGDFSSGGVRFDNVSVKKENKFKGERGNGEFTITVRTTDGDLSMREI